MQRNKTGNIVVACIIMLRMIDDRKIVKTENVKLWKQCCYITLDCTIGLPREQHNEVTQ